MPKRIPVLFIAVLLLASSLAGALAFHKGTAEAVTGAGWKAGRIIDDVVFTNKDAMSISQIQAYLDSKIGTGGYDSIPGQCDVNGARNAQPYSNASRADYATSIGKASKFTCLNLYYEVPKTSPSAGIPANNYGGKPIPAGAKSAAQLIWDAAQANNISPKVLLITIEKESAGPLVTDDWPYESQYIYAMGAHCPDSGPNGSANCDPNYAGFSIQISESAALFRYYLDNMNQSWWSYKKPGTNTILYNPNTNCGSSNVYIESMATAALYTYTPYQPNQAALDDLYGSGDHVTGGAYCSAFGNRNFWRMYNDRFGTTYAPDYSWQVTSQYAYSDSTKSAAIGLNNLTPGSRVFIGFTAKNTGNTTWTNSGDNPINVGTLRPYGRNSPFFDGTWLGPNRPGTLKEASVAPGQTGTFEFWITAPYNPNGNLQEYFGLLAERVVWFPDIGMYFNTNVQPPNYSWQLTSQYAFTDQTKTQARGLNNLEPGERTYVGLTVKNTGNITWNNTGPHPTDLGISHPYDRSSPFFDDTWLGPNRPARMKEAAVSPDQTATFEFWMQTPSKQSGSIYEYFNPVIEGISWMNDIGLNFYTTVVSPNFSWQPQSQYAFSDSSKTAPIGLDNLAPSQTVFVGLTAKNNSNFTWKNSGKYPLRVGTIRPTDRNSSFCTTGWLSCNRPASLKESSVAPGQIGTFEFNYKAPANTGTQLEYFSLLSEGLGWFNDPGLNFRTTVK